jgi:hypothetical protein
MRLLAICVALVVFVVSLAGAEVFFFETEEYDEEKSNPAFNEKGLNAAWDIKDDKDAFNKQYLISRGANRDVVEAAAGLVYIIPDVGNPNGWQLWARCMMPTTGSDSFFYQTSEDGGKNWSVPTAAHGAAQFAEWTWHRPWNIGTLRKGDDNALRIGERENNAKLDVICLRNDGQTPTDEEYEQYLKDKPKERFAVDARGKLADTWGRTKSDVTLDY